MSGAAPCHARYRLDQFTLWLMRLRRASPLVQRACGGRQSAHCLPRTVPPSG